MGSERMNNLKLGLSRILRLQYEVVTSRNKVDWEERGSKLMGPSKSSFEEMESFSLSSSRRPSIHEDSDGIEGAVEEGREMRSAAPAAGAAGSEESDSSWLKISIVRRDTLSSSTVLPSSPIDSWEGEGGREKISLEALVDSSWLKMSMVRKE